jgi:glycosyltransferase involved in cell wall biosynthesis
MEIVLVDDGSSDDSVKIAQSDPLVRLKQQPAKGVGAARNVGLDLAVGEIIAFLDADDLWPINSLKSRMDALLASPDLDGVYGSTEQFLSPEFEGHLSTSVSCAPIQARVAGAMVLRRRVFDRVGTFNTRLILGDTIDYVARMDEAGIQMGAIDDVVLQRRVHQHNTVLTQRKHQGDYLKILKAALDRRRSIVLK